MFFEQQATGPANMRRSELAVRNYFAETGAEYTASDETG